MTARLVWLAPLLMACVLGRAAAHIAIVDDGADGRPAAIRLSGPILKGANTELEAAVQKLRQGATSTINGVPFITIELDSPGGDVVEALDLGRTIYQNFLMTLVRPGHECVSACVFVLMAGAVHTPQDGANVGVHRPLLVSWSHRIGAAEAHARYDGLMAYLRQYFATLGVADAAYDMMMRTNASDMRYFSAAELDRLRLRGEDPAWEQFYGRKWAAANAPLPSPMSTTALANPALAHLGPVGAPRLAPVDQSYRGVIYMPGSADFGKDYMASLDLPKLSTGWLPFDDGAWQPLFSGVDLLGKARLLGTALLSRLGPLWWLIALVAVELSRARPWPGQRKGAGRSDQWRLAGLVSRGSAEAPGRA